MSTALANLRPGYCFSCWDWCPGTDADGFCLLADRSGFPGANRTDAVAAQAVVVPRCLHTHRREDRENWRVLLDGVEVPVEEWWYVSVANPERGETGLVETRDKRHLHGHVEIVSKDVIPPQVVPVDQAPPVETVVPVVPVVVVAPQPVAVVVGKRGQLAFSLEDLG